MTLNYVTLTLDLYDGQGNFPVSGLASFTPSAVLTDAGVEIIGQQPIVVSFHAAAVPTVKLLATDNSGPLPTGWTWGVTFSGMTGSPAAFSFFLPAAAVSFTATNASPCVFTVGSGNAPANGTGVQLSGGSLPAGFSSGTTYYVISASGATFELAATQGGAALGSTGSGSGTVTTVSQLMSNLIPVSAGTTFQAFMPQVLTTLGDIVYENAAPAPARLAGNTSSTKNFLTQTGTGSVSAAPAWAAIAAADLPAATTSTQGALILDGTASDIQPDGVAAAGTKGQAADAKHVHPLQPYQFLPEAYGAKRDGRFLYDAKMNGTTAVLTTAGLPAPSAPTLSNSGSGGSLTAGTYQVKVTYVNQYGETVASSSASQAISGTQPLTVTSPGSWTNATGYYVYCTQAGGSTFTRQQSPGSPTPLRTSYALTANPSSGGANPPGANTSNSAPFTAGDVGKSIIVPSAGGFTNVPLVTTIASFQSSTQVTLTAASSAAVTGAGAVYGTDDTSAIQQAINAAVAYAQTTAPITEQATGEVVFSDGIYIVAGALGGTYQNAQIQIPYINPYVGPKINLKLTGAQEASGPVHWEQPNPQAMGTTLASVYYSDSGSPPTPNPAVIGGPVSGGGLTFGGNGGLFSNMRVIVDGLNILVAYRCSISGLDLYGTGQADIRSFSYFAMARTLVGSAGGWPPYISDHSNPSPWQCFGYRTPTVGNNDQNDCDRLTVYGPYHGVVFTDHFAAASVKCLFCFNAVTAAQTNTAHHCVIASLSAEATSIPVFCDTGNAQVAVTVPSLHIETADFIIKDTGNSLYGEVRAEMLGVPASPPGLVAGGKNGAANIRLIWDGQPLGAVGSPPAVPSSTTAFTNTYWRDAVVIVSGGTVSVVAVDGVTTGLTSGPVFVRSGGTITLTYSAAPSWHWILA